MAEPGAVRLGLRANAAQFTLLVAVNALVGGMLGQERTVLPLLATRTQVHDGAQMSMSGTGTATSQPATSTGLRP